jgi:hypothetical protein
LHLTRNRIRQHTSAYVSIRQHTHKTHHPFASDPEHPPPAAGCTCAFASRPNEGTRSSCPYTSAYVSIRQHTSAYVCIRLHASAYVSIRQHTSAYDICQFPSHTSAYVSIRQHTSAYVICFSPNEGTRLSCTYSFVIDLLRPRTLVA